MSKRVLNQNSKYVQELIDMIEPDFIFNDKPINRLKIVKEDENTYQKKINELSELKKEISSIENCNIKNNSKNLIMGDGNINSPIMLIGETPGEIEDKIGNTALQDATSKDLKGNNYDEIVKLLQQH